MRLASAIDGFLIAGAETKTVVTLVPGKHTLQLIVGGEDHVIRAQAPHSKLITVTVQ